MDSRRIFYIDVGDERLMQTDIDYERIDLTAFRFKKGITENRLLTEIMFKICPSSDIHGWMARKFMKFGWLEGEPLTSFTFIPKTDDS